MANALKFKHIDIGRQQGELARLRVIQGVDYGALFVITGTHATVGRGEENDIVISDLKSSRNHAELFQVNEGWGVRDLKSANGIKHNGVAVKQAQLKFNDTLVIGETTFEFITSDVGTQMLVAPMRTPEQIQSEYQKIAELPNSFQYSGLVSGSKGPGIQKGVLIGAGLVILYFLMGSDPKPPSKSKSTSSSKGDSSKVDLATFLPHADPNKTAETLYKDGFREYLAGNYTRARTQFETVLQIVPGHSLATLYLENCGKAVENAVKLHLSVGKKSLDSGKLRDARANYNRVMRLLYRDQSNPAYLEAKDQLEKVILKMNEAGNE